MPQAVLERQGYEASCSYLRPAHLSGTLYLRHTHRSALRKSPTCCHNRGTRQEKVKTSLTAVLGCTTIAALLSAASLEAAEITASVQPHQAHYREAFLLAGNEDFWQNLTQYARFFVSVLAGTAYVAFKPLAGLLKKPSTAIALVISLVGFGWFVRATLTAMLGNPDAVDPFAL